MMTKIKTYQRHTLTAMEVPGPHEGLRFTIDVYRPRMAVEFNAVLDSIKKDIAILMVQYMKDNPAKVPKRSGTRTYYPKTYEWMVLNPP